MEPMNPDQIIEAYKVVAQDVQNRAAEQAARIGNAQRSLGTLAERVASPSGQTYGLANYTYNRAMRPVVDSTAASLMTTGYANALENNLKTSLREAKNKYEDAKNRYTVASSGGGGGNNNNTNGGYKEQNDNSYTGGTATGDSVARTVDQKLKQWSWATKLTYKDDIIRKLYEEEQAGNLSKADLKEQVWYVMTSPNYNEGHYLWNPDTGKWRAGVWPK